MNQPTDEEKQPSVLRPNTCVGDIVRNWLQLNGFDGLANGEIECGCHLDDFLICWGDYGGFDKCKPAYKFTKANGDWWMHTDKNWKEDDDGE